MSNLGKESAKELMFIAAFSVLAAFFFPHPELDELSFTVGKIIEIEQPKKRRYSFLLKIEQESGDRLTLTIPTNNRKENWERVDKKLKGLKLEEPVKAWCLDLWFVEPQVWHLQQENEVVVNYDDNYGAYQATRIFFLLIGLVLGAVALILTFVNRNSR